MNLVLFNFTSDKDSQALGFAQDWVRQISKNTDKLYVISLRCGRYEKMKNVEVFCINQDKLSRFQTILQIYKTLNIIHKKDKNISGYFVHMAFYFVPIIYPFALFHRQKIVLWYSHKSVTFMLKIANFLAHTILASTKQGYNIKTKKLKIIGQGIDTQNRFVPKKTFSKSIKNIITVGRISEVKNTKKIVDAFLGLQNKDIYLYIVGDILVQKDKIYLQDIKKSIPKEYEKNIIFMGSISFDKLPSIYENMDLAINISDTGSLDKTIIEPMAMGIGVITSNKSAKEIFGHLDTKGVYLLENMSNLQEKLNQIISKNQTIEHQALISEIQDNHSLPNLANKIVSQFDK